MAGMAASGRDSGALLISAEVQLDKAQFHALEINGRASLRTLKVRQDTPFTSLSEEPAPYLRRHCRSSLIIWPYVYGSTLALLCRLLVGAIDSRALPTRLCRCSCGLTRDVSLEQEKILLVKGKLHQQDSILRISACPDKVAACRTLLEGTSGEVCSTFALSAELPRSSRHITSTRYTGGFPPCRIEWRSYLLFSWF